jgi:hypothetical protein
MVAERRLNPRYVVDGLRAELDGTPHEILDISVDAVRVLSRSSASAPAAVRLRLVSEDDDGRALDVVVPARLQRATALEAVFRYAAPLADWPRRLAGFDTFADLSVPEWED